MVVGRGVWVALGFAALIPGAERGVALRIAVGVANEEPANGAERRAAAMSALARHVSHRGVALLGGAMGPSMAAATLGAGLAAEFESALRDVAASAGNQLARVTRDGPSEAAAVAPAVSAAERVFVAMPGFARRWIESGGRLGAAPLEREVILEGRITTAESRPVAGAVVRAEPRFDGEGAVLAVALSDADGVFRLHGLAAVPVSLSVEKRGYAVAGRSEVLPGERVDIVLEPVGQVSGVVRAGSAPVEATVTIAGSGIFPPLVTASTRLGEFALAPLPPGIYWVRAETRSGEASKPVALEVSAAAPHRTMGISVVLAKRATGRVLGRDGNGVAGAVVMLSDAELSILPVVAVTGVDGRFSRALWPADANGASSVFATVFAPGYPPNRAEALRFGDSDAGVTIDLRPSGIVSGRVQGPSDEPVDSAALEVTSVSSEGGVTIVSALTVRALSTTLAALGVPYREKRSFRTDTAGQFRLDGIAPGSISVRVTHPHFTTGYSKEAMLAVGGEAAFEIRMARASGVAGVVEDAAGRPLAGALVRVVDAATGRYEAVARAHEDGRFRLRCGPGQKRLEAVKESYSGDGVEVVVSPRAFREDVVLRLVAGDQRVLGRVLDGADAPVAGAEVTLTLDRGRAGGGPRSAVSDDAGRFLFDGIAAGRYSVRVAKDGYPTVVRANVPLDAEFDVRLVEGGRVVGRVTRERFRVVDAFRVTTTTGGAATGVDGRFELGALRAGAHTLRIDAEGLVAATLGVVVKVGETSEVEIDLEEGGAVSGEVASDADGRGVALATVDVGGRVVRTDASGRFRVDGLRVGAVSIRVSARGFETIGGETVEIRRGDEVRGLRLVVIPVRNP